MIKRIVIKSARLCACVVLGVVLSIALGAAVERWTPGYKYYTEVGG